MSKLKHVWGRRPVASLAVAVFSCYFISILFWLAVANQKRPKTTEPEDYEGVLLTVAVVLISFLIVPTLLRRKP